MFIASCTSTHLSALTNNLESSLISLSGLKGGSDDVWCMCTWVKFCLFTCLACWLFVCSMRSFLINNWNIREEVEENNHLYYIDSRVNVIEDSIVWLRWFRCWQNRLSETVRGSETAWLAREAERGEGSRVPRALQAISCNAESAVVADATKPKQTSNVGWRRWIFWWIGAGQLSEAHQESGNSKSWGEKLHLQGCRILPQLHQKQLRSSKQSHAGDLHAPRLLPFQHG